jgi:hypothetical protein
MLADDGGALMHQGAALAGRHLRPFLLGAGSVADGGVHIGGVTLGGSGDLLAGRGVHHGEGLVADRGHVAAADEMQAGHLLGEGEAVEFRSGRGGVRRLEHGGAPLVLGQLVLRGADHAPDGAFGATLGGATR